MRPLGSSRRGGGPPPGWHGSQPGPHEPPLQGAFGGRGVLGELAVQQHANQARPPERVLAAQGQGGVHDRLGSLRCRGPATVIVGGHGG
jgi:hypothetical protein